jgi:hypothetical protein
MDYVGFYLTKKLFDSIVLSGLFSAPLFPVEIGLGDLQ